MHMFVDKTEYWSKEGILFYFNGREDRAYIFNRDVNNRVEVPFCPFYCSTSMAGRTEHTYSTEMLIIE